MAEIQADTTAAAITEDLRATLAAATAEGATVFSAVGVYDDLASFERTADPAAGPVCGVIVGPPEQGPPIDNADGYTYRLPLDVAVRFALARGPGAAEQPGTAEAQRLAGIVRRALLRDRGRHGRAQGVEWGGRVLDGTDCQGSFRPAAGQKPNQGFYTAVIPAACGWATEAETV